MFERFQRFPMWLILVVSILLTAGIAWADSLFGDQVSLRLLLVGPVLLAAWRVNLLAAVLLAFVAVLMDLFDGPSSGGTIVAGDVWELGTRFGLIAIVAGLTSLWRNSLERQRHLARTDALTGLLNANACLERINAERNRSARCKQPLTLAFIDCDQFKDVNDTLGHLIGNEVLKTIAATLRSHTRSYDVSARWGGDEFVLLLPETSSETGRRAIERVHDALQSAMQVRAWSVTFSIGVVTFVDVEPEASEMVRAADELMLQVKRSTKRAIANRTITAGQPAETEIVPERSVSS